MKIFNGTNRTKFTNNIIPIEKNNYICIAAIDIDSVLKIENKRAYPLDDEIVDKDSDSDIDSNIDSHNNFSVPDSYVIM